MNESVGLKQQLDKLQSSSGSGIKRCREIFEFAESALRRFRSGTPEVKRTIVSTICSNWILRDKRVLISAQKPFLVIRSFLETPFGRNAMFEPAVLGLPKDKMRPDNPVIYRKLRFLNDVRTAVRENLKAFFGC